MDLDNNLYFQNLHENTKISTSETLIGNCSSIILFFQFDVDPITNYSGENFPEV